MSRASEEILAQIHGLVADEIKAMLESDDLKIRVAGLDRAMKFLKDNQITSTLADPTPISAIQQALPTREELEKLMTMTPD